MNFLYKKILLVAISVLSTLSGMAQNIITGMVADDDHQPLVGATVLVAGTEVGTVTDVDGKFSITAKTNNQLIISFIGYTSDTVSVNSNPIHIILQPSDLKLDDVVIKSESTMFDELKPMHNEVILESELLKAACCNLSESFETNASVDVSLTDAVSGAKMIRMLGLDGRYVQINRENVPLVRGLTGRYGLEYVPGTWIQSIDVGKGAGSVVNGYESMSGQINLEYKKPENSESLYLNGYVNGFGRIELNANHARDLNDKWSTAFLLHTDYMNNEVDRNDDGFLDLPKTRQINFLNRYKYQGNRINSQIGIQFMADQKAGGQTGFNFGDSHNSNSIYGFSNDTKRIEVFGKTGVLYPQKPYMGFGFIYSGSYQEIDAGFGNNLYNGKETTFYFNAIHQNIFGSSFHQYKTGFSMLYDDFQEVYADSAFNRQEIVPGGFFEYSYVPGDKISIVAGGRIDYHNLYGMYYTPRIHTRFQLSGNTTLRLAAGRGYRTPNALTENTRFLVSSRQFIVTEEIDPEVSWNLGGSLVFKPIIGGKEIQVITDYFYTTFENQMIVDQDASSQEIRIYNLDGDSYAHSFQTEASVKLNNFFTVKGAYKFYDVKSTINGNLMEVPYVSRNRFFINGSYASKFDKWTADFTLNWIGAKRLPNTSDKPTEFQREAYSQDYILANAQISRGFKWGSVYLGSENLFDFRQSDPIIDAENPFGNNFDASIVWGPIPGRLVYLGFRYKIKRNN